MRSIFFPQHPNSVEYGNGIITLRSLISWPWDEVEFIGPPPRFRSNTNGVLESFKAPVPFP